MVSGENQYFIGNKHHHWPLHLEIFLAIAGYRALFSSAGSNTTGFVTRDDRPELHQLFDPFYPCRRQRHRDADQCKTGSTVAICRFSIPRLPLGPEEQRWLQKHRRVRLLVNPYFPPFTLVDNEDELRGIMADMLNIVPPDRPAVWTPILACATVAALAKRMEKEDLGDHARRHPGPHSRRPTSPLSDPLINVAFVLVARGSAPDQHLLTRSARIALPGRAYRRPLI